MKSARCLQADNMRTPWPDWHERRSAHLRVQLEITGPALFPKAAFSCGVQQVCWGHKQTYDVFLSVSWIAKLAGCHTCNFRHRHHKRLHGTTISPSCKDLLPRSYL